MNETPIKVLVVEDEEGLADAMARLLRLRGLDAFYTLDGSEGVAMFKERNPEICIIDYELGYSKLDGLQVLEEIRKTGQTVECIVAMHDDDKRPIEKAKALGATRILIKPLDSPEWRDVVMEVAEIVRERKRTSP